jgi:hypothetical protein
MKRPEKFDPWYSSVWTWIWLSAMLLGVVLGITAK